MYDSPTLAFYFSLKIKLSLVVAEQSTAAFSKSKKKIKYYAKRINPWHLFRSLNKTSELNQNSFEIRHFF